MKRKHWLLTRNLIWLPKKRWVVCCSCRNVLELILSYFALHTDVSNNIHLVCLLVNCCIHNDYIDSVWLHLISKDSICVHVILLLTIHNFTPLNLSIKNENKKRNTKKVLISTSVVFELPQLKYTCIHIDQVPKLLYSLTSSLI